MKINYLANTILALSLVGMGLISGCNSEPKNRARYIESQFADPNNVIRYDPEEDNFKILEKYTVGYEDKNNLIRIGAHYFQKEISKNYWEFDPNTQQSDLEKTCKMVDKNGDLDLSNSEITKKLKEINGGREIIDLTKLDNH